MGEIVGMILTIVIRQETAAEHSPDTHSNTTSTSPLSSTNLTYSPLRASNKSLLNYNNDSTNTDDPFTMNTLSSPLQSTIFYSLLII